LVPVEIETQQLGSPSLTGTPEAVPNAAASGEPMQPPGMLRRYAVEEDEQAIEFTKRKFGDTPSTYIVPYL
jgi:hypothetical protein